jgi:hypothetical protein
MRGSWAITVRGVGPRRLWMLALLLCVLATRSLIPAGWMPAAAGSGYPLQLCTGAGAMSVWVDGDGKLHKKQHGSDDRADQPCSFAGFLNLFALPEHLGPPAAIVAAAAEKVVLYAIVAIGNGLAAPPPPQTGPPLIL